MFEIGLQYHFLIIALLAGIFISLKWVLSFFIKNTCTRKIIAGGVTCLLIPVFYLYATLFLIFTQDWKDREFEKSLWISDKKNRYTMAKDLIASKKLLGKDTLYLKSILGEPTQINVNQIWEYEMGTSVWGFGIAIHFLNVKV